MLSCGDGLISDDEVFNIIEACRNIDFGAIYEPIQVKNKSDNGNE